MAKRVLNKNEYLELQSSIDMRSQLAHSISTSIKQTFLPGESCTAAWKTLFVSPTFEQAPKLGQGSYGLARLISLKRMPQLELAIKKTKKMELDEVIHTIVAGTLPEAKVNPHFNIFYMHLHCEELDTPLFVAQRTRLVDWKTAETKIRELLALLPSADAQRKLQLKAQMDALEKYAYPSAEDIRKYHTFKLQQEHEFWKLYGEFEPEHIPTHATTAMKHIRDTYHTMQLVRSKYHKSYEYILMELAESEAAFKHWVQKAPPAAALISAAFQVCMAALSLMAFFKLTQNDLLLNNITYNPVKPDVFYVYKIGQLYLKVPLWGKLVKVFDFGLTTDTKTFYQPTRPNHVPTHWCVGGRGSGAEDTLACSVYVRDILELFFRLKDEYGCTDNGICYPKDPAIVKWLNYAHAQAQQVSTDSLTSTVNLILDIFKESTMKRFHLPITVEMSTQALPLSSYQTQPFEVINRKKYMKTIYSIMEEKIWQA